jgi:hypothetical protein
MEGSSQKAWKATMSPDNAFIGWLLNNTCSGLEVTLSFGGRRAASLALESYKVFVDAGWFLDIPPYVNRSDGMTFAICAHAVAELYNGTFDRFVHIYFDVSTCLWCEVQ